LDRHNIPGMIVNTLESLLRDPHLEATGFWQTLEHPSEGMLRLPGLPATYSKTPGAIRRLPPRLGEHSAEILGEAGFSAAEIDGLLASGATRHPDLSSPRPGPISRPATPRSTPPPRSSSPTRRGGSLRRCSSGGSRPRRRRAPRRSQTWTARASAPRGT